MTATVGAVARWLDELQLLRENAALGSLRVGSHYGIHLYAGEEPVGTTLKPADAACIVAEHNAVPDLIAAVRAVAERHRPWYEIKGVRHDNTVTVPCTDFADCDGTFEHDCAASDGDGHEVLACYECRCVVEYDIDGFLLWPCPTVRALTSALSGRDDHNEEAAR